MKDKKVVDSSQHGCMKGESCLTNLMDFYNEITSSVDEGRAVHVFYLDFSKAFDTVSHNILIDKFMEYGLHKWTVKWIENWLNCQA